METSWKYSLNSIDWKKIGKWALIALGWALFTYIQSVIVTIDFGSYTPIIMAVNSIIINIVTKFLSGQKV